MDHFAQMDVSVKETSSNRNMHENRQDRSGSKGGERT